MYVNKIQDGQPIAFPPGSTVLVTGASGYIASNVVDLFLELGYLVRGTSRSAQPWLSELFDDKYGEGKYEHVVVPDLAKEGALDEALRGVSGVLHVAADVTMNVNLDEVVKPGIAIVHNLLAAAAATPSVRRFVITSSIGAVVYQEPQLGRTVAVDAYNDEAVEIASGRVPCPNPARLPVTVYCASKVLAEKAAWAWYREHRPEFSLNVLVPNFNTGRFLSKEPRSSTGVLLTLFHGNGDLMPLVAPQNYIDVQDTARLHAVALLNPAVNDERVFALVRAFTYTEVLAFYRAAYPDRTFPSPPEDEGRDDCVYLGKERAESLLRDYFGKTWTSLEDSLRDSLVRGAGLEGFNIAAGVQGGAMTQLA